MINTNRMQTYKIYILYRHVVVQIKEKEQTFRYLNNVIVIQKSHTKEKA